MREARLSKKDAARVKQLLAQPRPCLLCGVFPPEHTCLFFPNQPELWGGKRGKARVICYALCARCKALPDHECRAEARMMKGISGRRN